MEELRILSGKDELYIWSDVNSTCLTTIENNGDVAQIVFTKSEARTLGEWLIKSSEEQ